MNAAPNKQRGVALITAILVVALATILAVDVAFSGYLDQRRTANLLVLDQGFEIALGAEAFAADALSQDDKKKDHPGEGWATPITLPVDGGELEGFLEDMQGRFNLNNLVKEDGTANPDTLAQFQRLLQALQIDTKWAGMIADWIDTNNVVGVPDGAEDNVYNSENPPYLAPNMPITRVSELLALKGFGLDNYQKLEPYVTALPVGTALNLCSAAGAVLDSLTAENGPKQYGTDLSSLQRNRQDGCYPTLAQVEQSFGNDEQYKKLKAKPGLAETTSYFRANVWVTIGTAEFSLYSLLHRNGNGQTRAILRSFGTP